MLPKRVETPDDGQGKKRRRGKRGGKRNRREDGEGEIETSAAASDEIIETAMSPKASLASEPDSGNVGRRAVALAPANDDAPSAKKPKKPRRAARPKKAAAEIVAETPVAEIAAGDRSPRSRHRFRRNCGEARPPTRNAEGPPVAAQARASRCSASFRWSSSNVAEEPEAKAEEKPKHAGWWQRKGFF